MSRRPARQAAILADGDLVGPAASPPAAPVPRGHPASARRLGITRVTLRAKIRRYRLS